MEWRRRFRGLSVACILALAPSAVSAEPPKLELQAIDDVHKSGSISFALTITPPCNETPPPPLAIAFVLHGLADETATRHSLLSAITLLSARDRIALIDTDAGTPPLLGLSQAGFSSGLPTALRVERTQSLPLLFAGIAGASAQLSRATHHLQHILVLEAFTDKQADTQQLAALGDSLRSRGISVSALTRSGCDRSPLRSLISVTGGFCIESAVELPERIELLKASCAPPLAVQAEAPSEGALQLLDFSDLTIADPERVSVPLAHPKTVLVHASWPHGSPPASYGTLLVSSGRWNARIELPSPRASQTAPRSDQNPEYLYEGYLR